MCNTSRFSPSFIFKTTYSSEGRLRPKGRKVRRKGQQGLQEGATRLGQERRPSPGPGPNAGAVRTRVSGTLQARTPFPCALFSPSALPPPTPQRPRFWDDSGWDGGIPGHSQNTTFWKIRDGWVSRRKHKDVKGKKCRKARSQLSAAVRAEGWCRAPGLEKRHGEAGARDPDGRGGALLWLPRSPAPRTNLPPRHWRALGASRRDPPLATSPRPTPCPPTFSAFPGASGRRERKHPGLTPSPWTRKKQAPRLLLPLAW